ncbi:replication-associated protein [Sewage-associated circular DNA virus-23]|uniref:replication-associated protein n=1 Tax=Sewage-associated circular DNA virus-23 TaxID=1592090 RepID=UPI000586454C|nr:replication-associated protein [Sewage-associated circular DNA virus-23]AJD07539.1 replication-associated protein [Sewage-associated circular DNA virus-23]
MTSRKWVFTVNNYTDDEWNELKRWCMVNTKYAIMGKEVGPQCGTPHIQGYLSANKPHRRSGMVEVCRRARWEAAKGNDTQNDDYCRKAAKEGREVWRHGQPCTGAGQRTDLLRVAAAVDSGVSLREIASENPSEFIKFHRGILAYRNLVRPAVPRDFKTELHVFVGPPGSGKSRRAQELASSFGTVYRKVRGPWWNGYEQQQSVIIDDFYGWVPFDELLRVADRYQHQVEIKGGFEEFNSKIIIITSNRPIKDWYKFDSYDPEALYRRCSVYQHINMDHSVTDYEIMEGIKINY